MGSTASPWIRRFLPSPNAPARLICLPHAGGSASYFFPVARALSPEVDVIAIQYPGRQDRRRERTVDDLRVLADLVTAEVAPFIDRPTILFGHSLGATLGFEVAVRLQQSGIVPHALFASGRRAPSTVRDERTHLRSDADFIAGVKGIGGTADVMFDDEQVVDMILPALRGDYRAAESYRWVPTPALLCPIVCLIGIDDALVTVDEARIWAEHTAADFELGIFPGGHFYLDQQAPSVLAALRDSFACRPLRLPTVDAAHP